jgi:ELWxxDGT repeat protein
VLVVGKSIYFTTDKELWRSDGTAKGTVIVKQLDANSSHPAGLTSFDGKVFFTVEAGNFEKCAFWCSDGTRKGTAAVKQIYFGHPPEQSTFAVLGGTLFFAGFDGLYQSDGTAQGTSLVKRLDQESNILSMATVGTTLFLAATEPKVGRELWVLPVRTRSSRAADSAHGIQRSLRASPNTSSSAALVRSTVPLFEDNEKPDLLE